jgi:hypothetical protein
MLAQALDGIRTGRCRSQVQTVRRVLAREGKRAYDRAKAHLPAMTFGGIFLPTRGNGHLQQHSGIVHGDLDHLPNVAAVKQAICADPRTVYAFISPSKEGLKLGVHTSLLSPTIPPTSIPGRSSPMSMSGCMVECGIQAGKMSVGYATFRMIPTYTGIPQPLSSTCLHRHHASPEYQALHGFQPSVVSTITKTMPSERFKPPQQ